MHTLAYGPLHKILVALLLVGACTNNIEAHAEVRTNSKDEGPWVEVEPQNLLPSDITGVFYLVPYRHRREKWGHTLSLAYSNFTPSNYEPNFLQAQFGEVYRAADMPLMELQYTFKRNMALGSLGLELGVGMYKNTSDTTIIDSSLELTPVRLGATLRLDNLFFEPYVVPYGSVGAYTMLYEERVSTGANAYGGNTQISYYYSLGLEFQLNWIDREAARNSYFEAGIENTFIFVEARQFAEAQAAKDPDFSTNLDLGGGVRLEF